MTIDMLRARGVHVDEPDSSSWRIHPGPIRALDLRIEPDLTNAAAFLAAGAVTGGTVTVPGWPSSSLQPGAQFLNVAERMGCVIVQHDDEVTVTGPSRLQGVDVDLHGASELTPVVPRSPRWRKEKPGSEAWLISVAMRLIAWQR